MSDCELPEELVQPFLLAPLRCPPCNQRQSLPCGARGPAGQQGHTAATMWSAPWRGQAGTHSAAGPALQSGGLPGGGGTWLTCVHSYCSATQFQAFHGQPLVPRDGDWERSPKVGGWGVGDRGSRHLVSKFSPEAIWTEPSVWPTQLAASPPPLWEVGGWRPSFWARGQGQPLHSPGLSFPTRLRGCGGDARRCQPERSGVRGGNRKKAGTQRNEPHPSWRPGATCCRIRGAAPSWARAAGLLLLGDWTGFWGVPWAPRSTRATSDLGPLQSWPGSQTCAHS